MPTLPMTRIVPLSRPVPMKSSSGVAPSIVKVLPTVPEISKASPSETPPFSMPTFRPAISCDDSAEETSRG